MSDKVYSFTKVSKRHVESGKRALAVGILSLCLLAFFISFGIYKGGRMEGTFCLIPYVTMTASIAYAVITNKRIHQTDVAGKYLQAGYRVCFFSSVLHLLIFLLGILKIIM